MRVIDLKTGGEIIRHHDVTVFRFGLGDLQHHGKAIVLPGLGHIGRLAVEREITALDLEAVRRRGLRRHRRAAHRNHRLHRRIAGVGNLDRLAFQYGCLVAAIQRGFDRRAIDIEGQRFLCQRPRRQHQPGIFLGRGVRRQSARHFDARDGLRQRRPRCVAFARKRNQCGGIAQSAAVVGPAELQYRFWREAFKRGGIDPLRPALVADQRQRRRKLRFCNRGGQIVQLGIGKVAQIANWRGAVTGEHVEAVSKVTPAVLFRFVGVHDRVADAIERALEQHIRHRKSLFAGAGQEVRDVGVEPGVIAAGRPQPERSVGALPRQQTIDGILDALIHFRVHGEMRTRRQIIDVKQRHRPAGDLLRTSMRVTIQRLQDGRGIERCGQTDRQRDAAGALHQIRKHVGCQGQALTLGQRADRAAREDLRCRLDVERIMPRQRQSVRPLDIDIELRGSGTAGIKRQRHRGSLLGCEFYSRVGIARHLYGAGCPDIDGVIAGGAFDVVEVKTHGALIAIEQEARQRRGQHHGIADRDIGRGTAKLGRGPRHRHHPRGAGELRNFETDFSRAVGCDGDNPGIQRQRLLRRRTSLQLGARGIAAGLELAAGALHAVDQLPIEVADFRRHAALAEIVIVRRRRLVVGEVENTDIDRGDDDFCILAGT